MRKLKPSYSLKAFLLVSSLSIFFMGVHMFTKPVGMQIFNSMCLVIPFFTIYAWIGNAKKIVVYLLVDLHFFWWVIFAVISSCTGASNYFYISLPFILVMFYSILKQKENYVLL